MVGWIGNLSAVGNIAPRWNFSAERLLRRRQQLFIKFLADTKLEKLPNNKYSLTWKLNSFYSKEEILCGKITDAFPYHPIQLCSWNWRKGQMKLNILSHTNSIASSIQRKLQKPPIICFAGLFSYAASSSALFTCQWLGRSFCLA